MGCQKTRDKVQEIMDEEEMREAPESFIPILCDFVIGFRTKNPTLLNSLKSHSKYHLISSFLSSASKSVKEVRYYEEELLNV